jgi:hypothetical protein
MEILTQNLLIKVLQKTQKYFSMIHHQNTAIQQKYQPSSKYRTGEIKKKLTLVEILI